MSLVRADRSKGGVGAIKGVEWVQEMDEVNPEMDEQDHIACTLCSCDLHRLSPDRPSGMLDICIYDGEVLHQVSEFA